MIEIGPVLAQTIKDLVIICVVGYVACKIVLGLSAVMVSR